MNKHKARWVGARREVLFNAKVLRKGPNECWEWTGYRMEHGHGQSSYQGKGETTHRLAWFFANGPIPEGMHVLHHCDNPPCCNPAHLFLGTHLDNVADMNRKGRHSFGPVNQKLSRQDVARIKDVLQVGGASQHQVSKYFHVDWAVISRVRNGLYLGRG